MKLMLDTDVLRSGLQSADGASRLLLCGVAEGSFVPLVTVAIILEYEAVLLRPESLTATGMTTRDVVVFLDKFLDFSEQVTVTRLHRPSIQDPSDEIFVDALKNGGGEAIVTFNRRDYLDADLRKASRGKMPVPIMAPREALRRLAWRPTATTLFAFRRL
jgi:predicted nucleic acid-binding protein